MKPTEVRKGNLVEYDNRIFEIDSISEVFPTLNSVEFGIGVVGWYDLKPIKLNLEFIKNNLGFKFNGCMYSNNDDIVIKEDLSIIGIYNDDMFDDITLKLPEFVHDLQNLIFYITKKELPIKF